MEQLLMALKGLIGAKGTANPMQSTGASPFNIGDMLSGVSKGLDTISGGNAPQIQPGPGLPTGLMNAAVNLPKTSYGVNSPSNAQPDLLAILKQFGITP